LTLKYCSKNRKLLQSVHSADLRAKFRYKFTDQEWDNEFGLYNYNARLYDPMIGRFISADSIVPDPYDPQLLNRYSYVRNNPLKYIDPTGHHLGPTGPGGGAEFDKVDGSHAVGDGGWGELFNPSAPTQVKVRTNVHHKVIVQEFTYIVKRDEEQLASVKEVKVVGEYEPEGTPFEKVNKKYKKAAIEPTPETARAMRKAALCGTGYMFTLGLTGYTLGALEAMGYAASLPALEAAAIGALEAAIDGPPSTPVGQTLSLGLEAFGWCFSD